MSKRVHPKIVEFQKRDLPINYSNLLVSADGKLEERKSSLKDRVVKGYGVIWGSRNDYGETFVKGCFVKSIIDHGPASDSPYKIKFRDRHGKALGLMAVLKEDEIGVYFETKPLDNVKAADEMLIQLESGTINNFSIGFKHLWDRVKWDEETETMVNLEGRLFEISGVDIPSDIETFAVRSSEEIEFLRDDVEEFIHKLPGSVRLEARQIFTRCMSPIIVPPLEQRNKAPEDDTPKKAGLDTKYLIKKLKTT